MNRAKVNVVYVVNIKTKKFFIRPVAERQNDSDFEHGVVFEHGLNGYILKARIK